MAKISNVLGRKPIPTEVEGVYISDLPAKEVDEKFGDLQELMEKDHEKAITLLFTDLICDENGERFEDCQTFEDITENLSVRALHTIINAIPSALTPGAEAGKITTCWRTQVRTLLLANGSSLETVDSLPLSDQKNLFAALQQGLWGPIGQYSIAYQQYAMLHSINDTQVAVVAGKKHKRMEPMKFFEIYPTVDDAASLGTASEKRRTKTEAELSVKAALALGDTSGMSDWMKELLSST